jgi:hypothetical protein
MWRLLARWQAVLRAPPPREPFGLLPAETETAAAGDTTLVPSQRRPQEVPGRCARSVRVPVDQFDTVPEFRPIELGLDIF